MSKNVLSIEAFADWCEAQGDRAYVYDSPKRCACAEFLRANGFPNASVGMTTYYPDIYAIRSADSLPEWVDPAVKAHPHTFTALAARLRSSGGQTDG